MARSYKRDKNGRFSSTGGGGGKLGKSAKNEGARAKYKEASSKARATEKEFGGNSPAAGSKFAKRQIAGAKSGLTRVAQNLRGGAKGNLGASKPSAPTKAAARPKKAAAKAAAPARSRRAPLPRGMDGPQRQTKASAVSTNSAMARLSEGKTLKGKGNNPTARAERNLERGLAAKGKKARKSEATAKRAIDYMASRGTLGKRSNGTKKRK
jgi:hypothetical protein